MRERFICSRISSCYADERSRVATSRSARPVARLSKRAWKAALDEWAGDRHRTPGPGREVRQRSSQLRMPRLAHDHGPQPAVETRYRIAPWPVRVLIPLLTLVLIAGIAHDGTAPAVLIPVVVMGAIAYLVAAERVGLYCSASGFESRMTRSANSFRYEWSEVDRFDVVDNGAQVAIVVQLRDGSQRMLPSTRAWRYQRSLVSGICDELNRRTRARAEVPSLPRGL